MSKTLSLDELRDHARKAIKDLTNSCEPKDLERAKPLVEQLRNVRDYELLGRLAEAISRRNPKDAKNRRLYAQYLIETGKATAAVDLLRPLARRLPKDHPEFAEATGLLGRAHKQIFFDDGDKTSKTARKALKEAIAAYHEPFRKDPVANTWHGVNLVALLARARRLGIKVAPELKPKDVAKAVIAALEQVPKDKRDEWYLPAVAEASLGLGDWDAVERKIKAYAAHKNPKAFLIASTLRQLTQVWDVETIDERGRGLVDILRARLAELPGGGIELAPGELQRLRHRPDPDDGQLEAVLGDKGSETYSWWKTGLDRALSVAAVYQRNGNRLGTGFLVRAGDLGLEPADELLVLTNFHVVNEHGASPGIRPEEAEVAFEAADAQQRTLIEKILWSSPPDRHDASLLRLAEPIVDIEPLPLARALPALDDQAGVYIIGHPLGGALSFSFQDNKLLDHEDPPKGRPQIPGVCRVHYRAPTEGGSSGSPVFNGKLWQVIALHHKGGKIGMPRLNGQDGTYAANEGLSILAIKAELAAEMSEQMLYAAEPTG